MAEVSCLYYHPTALTCLVSSVLALRQKLEEYIEQHPDLTDGGCWIERVPKTNDLMFYYCGVTPKISWARRRDQEEIKLEFLLYMQKEARKLGIKFKKPDQRIEWVTPPKSDNKYIPRELNKSNMDVHQRQSFQPNSRDRFVM